MIDRIKEYCKNKGRILREWDKARGAK